MPEIAFIGRSNVGKSSLLNALTGRKSIARASVTPGRTQELNFFEVGDPTRLMLVDMPGYGFAKAPLKVVENWKRLVRDFLRGRVVLKRTLLLIDGRRQPPTTFTGLTDSGMAPELLVQRVDVVTGGVSAVYGSDAVAGVVNYILDRNFTGFKASAQAGEIGWWPWRQRRLLQATAKVGEHPWKRVRRDRPIVEQPALSAIQHQLRAQQVAVGGQRRCGAELGEVEQGNGRRRQAALQGTQGLRLQAPLVGTAQPLTFGPAGQHDQPSTALAGQGHGGSEGGLVVEAQLPLQGHGNGDGTGHGGGTEPAQPGRFSPPSSPGA